MDSEDGYLADRGLLAELAAVVAAAYPLPAEVVRDADASYLRRSPGSDIAPLTYDSVVDDELVGVRRGRSSSRHLTFEAGSTSIGVELFEGRRRMVGQVVPPPASGEVEVRHAEGSASIGLDDLGRFVAEDVPPGPVSFRWTVGAAGEGAGEGAAGSGAGADGTVVTDWVVI